jgi:hypothetical protein
MVIPIQKPLADLLFQRLEPCAGGGRRQECPARAEGQRARLGNTDEESKISKIEVYGCASVQKAFSHLNWCLS